LDYDEDGKLLITKCVTVTDLDRAHSIIKTLTLNRKHSPVTFSEIQTRVKRTVCRQRLKYFLIYLQVRTLLTTHQVTTNTGKLLPIGTGVHEVSICCHSDTPVRLLTVRTTHFTYVLLTERGQYCGNCKNNRGRKQSRRRIHSVNN
jgi:hypothetical protein